MAKILVTGATGFIGKKLTGKLVEGNNEVHVLEGYVTGRYSFDGKRSVTSSHTPEGCGLLFLHSYLASSHP